MDAITLLKEDHQKVKKLFTTLEKEKNGRAKTLRELASELTVHAEIEETLFYPAVKEAKKTHAIVLESYEEHKQVKTLLTELERLDPASDVWEAKLTVLKEDVEHHVKEEEGELFPKVREILPAAELKTLGTRMQEAKMAKIRA